MKKIIYVCLLLMLFVGSAFSQSIEKSITLYPTGSSGCIVQINGSDYEERPNPGIGKYFSLSDMCIERSYFVFELSSIEDNATITNVQVNYSTYTEDYTFKLTKIASLYDSLHAMWDSIGTGEELHTGLAYSIGSSFDSSPIKTSLAGALVNDQLIIGALSEAEGTTGSESSLDLSFYVEYTISAQLINLTVRNDLYGADGGYIGMAVYPYTAASRPSPFPFTAYEENRLNLAAYDNQTVNDKVWFFNNTEYPDERSDWRKVNGEENTLISIYQSFTTSALTTNDNNATFIAYLKTTTYTTSGTMSSNEKWFTSPVTLTGNVTVPSGVTLEIQSGVSVDLNGYNITSSGGTIAIESGATFTPDIRLMSGSTVLGVYTTIDDAFNNGSELHLRGEFIFNDTYTLTSGRKLVAQDGALLKYPSGKTLEIAGGGTLEGNNATFTSISGTWGGIYYQENSSGSLSGCTITHATTAIRDHSGKTGQDALVISSNIISDASYGISSLNSSTYIFYNNLTDITTRAINTSGVNASPEITFNEISNSKNGIYCSNGSTPYIYENTLSDIETYAIYCSGSNGSVVISNNELSNSGYGIISMNVPAGSEISDNTISNATTFGLYVYNGSPLIESNAITESGLFGLYFVNSNSEMHNNLITGGSGNYAFMMSSSSPVLYYNTISTTDALWAVYANNGSDPLFGQYENYTYTGFNYVSSGSSSEGVILASNASTPVMGGHIPQVWGNCKNSIIWQGTYYAAVASDGTSSIDARRCWWGQPSASACYGDVLTTYPLQSDPGSGSTLSKSSTLPVMASHPEEKPAEGEAKALWEVAMRAVSERNYTAALDDFQSLIRLYPASTYAYRALSMSVRLCREQKTRDMLTYLDELLTGVEDKTLRAVIKSRKVSEYRRMKDIEQAITLSREILAENPETIHETTALFDLFNLCQKDLADSVQAEYYVTELKTKYPEDELTGIARIDWGEDPEQIVIRKRTFPGQEEEILPETFTLGSAYPNPFNPVTNIQFSLPEGAHVILNIYDISGRLVEQLINQHTLAGYHTVTWDAARFSSGIYFARMQVEDVVMTKKMVLMK